MREGCCAAAVAVFVATRAVMLGAPGLAAPDLTVGRNLQMYATVRLSEPAPPAGTKLTLTSEDPKRLLLSEAPDKAGSASITLTVRPRSSESPEFWAQGLSDNGAVSYTAAGAGLGSVKGTVTLTPSAIAILGPFKLPSFPTTPRSDPSKLTLVTAALDSSMKVLEAQQVAGGSRVEVRIVNSNPEAGSVGDSVLTLTGGASEASTYFRPAAEGRATLTPEPPRGFSTPAEFATVIAMIEKPGLAVADDLFLGKDLQAPGVLCLGESPGPDGLKVTLTSSDPGKLRLSAREDQLGAASITLTVPPGQLTAQYYLQSLSDAGAVTYAASAPGFRSRVGRVTLSPSGMIVAYSRYGPPDEAAVLQRTGANDDRRFYASLSDSKEHPIYVVVWSVHLDPETGLAADFTVQPLRAGASATLDLKSNNLAVGTVESPLTIPSGANHVVSRFTPLKLGETVISVSTPPGFSTPKNATSVPATVID